MRRLGASFSLWERKKVGNVMRAPRMGRFVHGATRGAVLALAFSLIGATGAQAAGWSSADKLAAASYLHTATTLPNGKVLVAGGFDGKGDFLASAELYDPATGRWSAAGDMGTARDGQIAVAL